MKVLNIFVAEDNAADVVILGEMLNEHNVAHRLQVETEGEAAIRFITECDGQGLCPDMFVIDVYMPKADGMAIVKAIRDRPCFSTVPIFVTSNLLSKTEQRDIETIPLCFFFRKPVWLEEWFEICNFIRTLCDKSHPAYLPPPTTAKIPIAEAETGQV